jgi:hypothetical protein
VLHSASLAGVAEDADATPANLRDAGTYRLPALFAPSTSVSWLRQRFGKANVHVADVPGGEGETSRGVILFPTILPGARTCTSRTRSGRAGSAWCG